MSVIKCFKLKCEVCGVEGTCQVFSNKAGELRYGRARHYQKLENKKPVFEYHQQSKEYLIEQLKFVLPKIPKPIDQKQIILDQDADQNLKVSSCSPRVEPRAGFGPATITLPR
jgi:hypothetical protein